MKQLNSVALNVVSNPERKMVDLLEGIKKGISQGEIVLLDISQASEDHFKIMRRLIMDRLDRVEILNLKVIKYSNLNNLLRAEQYVI